jgi:hypothetical protein
MVRKKRIALMTDDLAVWDYLTGRSGALGPGVTRLSHSNVGDFQEASSGAYSLVLVDGEENARRLHEAGISPVPVADRGLQSQKILELLRSGSAAGFVALDIPEEELAACFRYHRRGQRLPNCFALFESASGRPYTGWDAMASGLHPLDLEAGECPVLFRSLIPPCSSRVTLIDNPAGQSGSKILRVKISAGDGPVPEDLAVKYGERRRIRNEAMHYDRYMAPLPDGVAAQLRWRAETDNLGALAYSWVGDSVADGVTLGPLGETPDIVTWDRRRRVIDRLFLVSLHSWYESYQKSEPVPEQFQKHLLAYYVGKEGLWAPETADLTEGKLSDATECRIPPPNFARHEFDEKEGKWFFRGNRNGFRNPVDWLVNGLLGRRSLSRLAPCHGDLHVRNLYILPDDSPRLIDFGNTTLGHVYRDFAALEVSIRLTCVKDTGLAAIQAAEDRVFEVETLGQEIRFQDLGGRPDLREAVRTTVHIRRAALEASGYHATDPGSMQEYLFAVTAHMLRYASGQADEIRHPEDGRPEEYRIWHALYGAARAADQAAKLGKPAQP